MSTTINVVISGGAGRIAYALIPLVCNGSIFGNGKRIKLRLLDIAPSFSKIQGVKMEILDCCYDLVDEVLATISPEEAFEAADVCILLGGFPRLPGMERRDLISKNVDIMKEQSKNIDKHANKDVKVLIVANPANTNCLVAMKSAPSIPSNNFSCLTRLDEERLRGFLLEEINSNNSIISSGNKITSSSVQNVAIFGNHSATQVPYANNATFIDHNNNKILVSDFCIYNKDELIEKVQKRGAEIIQAQQASSGLSAASAIGRHLRDWLCEDITNEIFSMGILSDDNPYNVPDGLVFSFPCKRISSKPGDIAIVEGLEINSHIKLLIEKTTAELQGEKLEAELFVGQL